MGKRKDAKETGGPKADAVSDRKPQVPEKTKTKKGYSFPPGADAGGSPRDGNPMAAWAIYVVMGLLIGASYYAVTMRDMSNTQKFLDQAERYQTPIRKNFNHTTLAYVTPWNGKGYDVAKTFNTKFDIVVPVWFQFARTGPNQYVVKGGHDVDQNWISDVRKNGKGAKVMPRFLAEGFDQQGLIALLTQKTEQEALLKTLVTELKNQKVDGLTLEMWSLLGGQAKEPLATLVTNMAQTLHANDLKMVLVIPPYRPGSAGQMFDQSDFVKLAPHVDYFSLMTYDFSSANLPGPSSPPKWIRLSYTSLIPEGSKLEKYSQKILLGINFYGNDFTHPTGGGPIVGTQYLDTMRKYLPAIKWEPTYREHMAEYSDSDGKSHTVYYPSKEYVDYRVKLASKLKCGISIWEIGQGLDNLLDPL